MSDGIEEREHMRARKEQQKREDRENWIEHSDAEGGEPERVDS